MAEKTSPVRSTPLAMLSTRLCACSDGHEPVTASGTKVPLVLALPAPPHPAPPHLRLVPGLPDAPAAATPPHPRSRGDGFVDGSRVSPIVVDDIQGARINDLLGGIKRGALVLIVDAAGAGKSTATAGPTPTSPVPPPTVAPIPAAAPAPDFSREFIALAAGWGIRELEGYKATLRAQQVPRDSIEGWLAAVREARGELEGDGEEPPDLPPTIH